MPEKLSFKVAVVDVLGSYIEGIVDLTGRTDQVIKDLAKHLQLAIIDGRTDRLMPILGLMGQNSIVIRENGMVLLNISKAFSRLLPRLLKDELAVTDIREFADQCCIAGAIFTSSVKPGMAHNCYAFAYGAYNNISTPCFEIAEKVLALADISNNDQYVSALWRFAVQTIIKSHQENGDFLAAIDAVETALNTRVSDDFFHEELCLELVTAMNIVKDSPLSKLMPMILLVSGSKEYAQPKKNDILKRLLNQEHNKDVSDTMTEAMSILAVNQQQAAIDDWRFSLFDYPSQKPSLSWCDLTLSHKNLTHALPLFGSLIADISRTGGFLLDLCHEVTHAYSMMGAIGSHRLALRVAVHAAEIMMGAEPSNELAVTPLASVPERQLSPQIAGIQLSVMYRSAILEATWRPWLEGLAMYVELLGDSKKDPTEILPVYEAIRSLIELNIPARAGEAEEASAIRYADESAKCFEDFHSEAIRRNSDTRHLGYLGPRFDEENAVWLRDINFYGYLLVRSVISRWENTLGHRLEPIIASKLVLFLTRFSSHDAIPDLTSKLDDLKERSEQVFSEWLVLISKLSKAELQLFFQPIASNSRGEIFVWINGKLQIKAPDFDMLKSAESRMDEHLRKISELLNGAGLAVPVAADPVVEAMQPAIRSLYYKYGTFMTLLPVGKDDSRLLLLNDEGLIGLYPRTYIGFSEADENNPNARQRFAALTLRLPGGATATNRLREFCKKNRTGRVLATRVIDFDGSRSLLKVPNLATVCFFLGKDWHFVSVAGTNISDIDIKYADLLKERVLSPAFFADEIETISSLDFLKRRLSHQLPDDIAFFKPVALSRRVAFAACARAFDARPNELEQAVTVFSDAVTKSQIADYLLKSGIGIPTEHAKPNAIEQMFFDRAAYSGIKPFNL